MKTPDFFTKIDKNILKKHPFQWIIGWHIFLVIILALMLFAAALAYITPTNELSYSNKNSLIISSVFVGFLSFMAFILYIIRQIKFNSFRIHHNIPYTKSKLFFFSFWLIIFLFCVIPFVPMQTYTLRIRSEINSKTDDFEKDTEILRNTMPFFLSSYDNLEKPDIIFEGDNIIIKKSPMNLYYTSTPNHLPIKISKKEAITEIENFIEVTKKYDIKLLIDNPEEIYKKRKNFNIKNENKSFSLFYSTNQKNNNSYDRYAYLNMIYSYQRQMNNSLNFKILFRFLLTSILLTTFLWIFISVTLPDFGLSILLSVLIMIFMGIVVAILSVFDIKKDNLKIVFFIAILILYLIAFLGNRKNRIIRVLKIVCHYLVPIFLLLVIDEIDDKKYYKHEFYYFSSMFISGMIISVFLFNEIYKKIRLLPK